MSSGVGDQLSAAGREALAELTVVFKRVHANDKKAASLQTEMAGLLARIVELVGTVAREHHLLREVPLEALFQKQDYKTLSERMVAAGCIKEWVQPALGWYFMAKTLVPDGKDGTYRPVEPIVEAALLKTRMCKTAFLAMTPVGWPPILCKMVMMELVLPFSSELWHAEDCGKFELLKDTGGWSIPANQVTKFMRMLAARLSAKRDVVDEQSRYKIKARLEQFEQSRLAQLAKQQKRTVNPAALAAAAKERADGGGCSGGGGGSSGAAAAKERADGGGCSGGGGSGAAAKERADGGGCSGSSGAGAGAGVVSSLLALDSDDDSDATVTEVDEAKPAKAPEKRKPAIARKKRRRCSSPVKEAGAAARQAPPNAGRVVRSPSPSRARSASAPKGIPVQKPVSLPQGDELLKAMINFMRSSVDGAKDKAQELKRWELRGQELARQASVELQKHL